jgi:hypothetical protein
MQRHREVTGRRSHSSTQSRVPAARSGAGGSADRQRAQLQVAVRGGHHDGAVDLSVQGFRRGPSTAIVGRDHDSAGEPAPHEQLVGRRLLHRLVGSFEADDGPLDGSRPSDRLELPSTSQTPSIVCRTGSSSSCRRARRPAGTRCGHRRCRPRAPPRRPASSRALARHRRRVRQRAKRTRGVERACRPVTARTPAAVRASRSPRVWSRLEPDGHPL